MSDRWVFLAASMTVVLVVAGAFAIPELFVYHLLESTIFVVICVMVFFGDDKVPYMMGMVTPVLWIIFSILTGGVFKDFAVLGRFLSGRPLGHLDTPLDGFAYLSGLALLGVSARAWRKEVPEKFFGKPFVTALIVSAIWLIVLTIWQFH